MEFVMLSAVRKGAEGFGERNEYHMVLQLRQIFEIEGQKLSFDEQIPLSELENSPLHEAFAAPLHIKGCVYNRAGVVALEYTVSALLDQECDRCLKAFQREYDVEASHTVVKELAAADADDENGSEYDDYIVCPENTLDMNELAVTDLLMEMPSKILCKEDCKGLCMSCGKNLNDGACDCQN
jgi:uncharacterized protein